jgi:hypothetical protein
MHQRGVIIMLFFVCKIRAFVLYGSATLLAASSVYADAILIDGADVYPVSSAPQLHGAVLLER